MEFRQFVYVATGFLQHAGTRTRLIRLFQDLYSKHGGGSTMVKLMPWNSDWRAEAEFLHRTATADAGTCMVAYSWGAGWGFTEFSKAMQRRGRPVDLALLIDPVYRHRYWLGNWRAFVPGVPIRVPSNVCEVQSWRQKQSHPRGHCLTPTSQKTTIVEHEVKADHIHMDDHPTLLKDVAEVVSAFLGDTPCELRPPYLL